MDKTQLIQQLCHQGITSSVVLNAIAEVPRDQFISIEYEALAYANQPLPIGHDQTISQPYIVARMTELLLAGKTKLGKVLEIGTGSGYQAAVLAKVVDKLYTIERILPLLEQAKNRFEQLKLTNIYTLHGDGYLGWPEYAPFDGILVTAAAPALPQALLEQLSENGKLLIPVGMPSYTQELQLITRQGKNMHKEIYDPVIFVPMLAGRINE